MKRVIHFIAVAFLGVNAAAHADTLAGGPVYGGIVQSRAVCYLYNAGVGPVSVTTNVIVRQGSTTPLTLTDDNCAILAANAGCAIATNIVSNQPHSCKMVVSPSGADIRGNFEIRGSLSAGDEVLNNVELR